MPKPKLKPIPGFRSEAGEGALRLANEQDVPYQSLMKVYLAERVATERLHRRGEQTARKRVEPTTTRPKARGRAKAK